MPIYPRGSVKERILAPAGMTQAVCYDVWDLGLQEVKYKGDVKLKPQLVFAFELAEVIPDGELAGKRYTMNRKFNNVISDKSNLKKFVEAWRGQPFASLDEYEKFDFEALVGVNATLNVVHATVEGTVYANIASIGPMMRGAVKLEAVTPRAIPDWVRERQESQAKPDVVTSAPKPMVDEQGIEIPF